MRKYITSLCLVIISFLFSYCLIYFVILPKSNNPLNWEMIDRGGLAMFGLLLSALLVCINLATDNN